MAMEASGPLGVTWGYWVAGMAAVALVLTIAFVVAHRGRIFSVSRGLIVWLGLGTAAWALLTVGDPVMVSIPEDPQGAECLINPFGEKPGYGIRWSTDCGQALRGHLIVSGGPPTVAVGGIFAVLVLTRRQRKQVLSDAV